MKLSCTQENLQKGVHTVSHLTGKNLSLPILGNILLRAEKGALVLSTTNLEVGITHRVRAKVEQEGSYTVQGRVFSEFVTLLPKEQVDLELRDTGLYVAAGKHTGTIKGTSAEEFPVIPQINAEKRVAVDGKKLREAIQQTLFAAANDESRPEISGVLFVFQERKLTIAATDSYRLTERTLPIESEGPEYRAILPVKTLAEILRILPDDADEAELFLEETQFALRAGEVEIVSRVIEGQYPDYQQIIPKESTTEATFSRQDFINNVKAASLFCKPGVNDLTLEIQPGGKRITFRAANAQVGEQTSEIAAAVRGKDVTLVFNYRYLLDGLANFPDDEISLSANDQKNPGLFKTKGRDDYLYLVMPIRQ